MWALAIEMEPQTTRMRKCTDAVSRNKNDSFIFMAIGKIFWEEQKPLKPLASMVLTESIRKGEKLYFCKNRNYLQRAKLSLP